MLIHSGYFYIFMSNKNLANAKKAKNDEFYTQLSDIEKELQHYTKHFKGKVVFCNCDDPTYSNFWKYFHLNFGIFELKKLVTTHYSKDGPSYKMEYLGGNDNNCEIGIQIPLKENGDFRSQECVDILKDSDIVVTNPPFSLFREYVAQLIKYNKKFIIIGNKNAVTYKEVFPLIKNNRMWLGYGSASNFKTKLGKITKKLNGLVRWFTNEKIPKLTEKLFLTEKYDPKRYPKYDNYDAINVDKVAEIPKDYNGVMGVPISFLDKYCPEQFEIWGATESEGKGFSNGLWDNKSKIPQPIVDICKVYKRLFITKVA